MGIRFYCPNGHKLNVKSFQAGRRGICPFCGAKIIIPTQSTRRSSKAERAGRSASAHAGAEQEVVLQTDPARQPVPVAQQVESIPATGGTSRTAPAAGGPAAPSAEGGTLPIATPLGFRDSTSAAAPGKPIEAAPLVAASLRPSPAAGVQVLSAEPLPTQPTLQSGVQTPSQFQAPPAAPARDEPPDPLAEADSVVWYVRPPSGGQFGPATSDVMRTWIGEGRVSADSLVWREGWRDWLVAGEVFPQLGAGKNEFAFSVLGTSQSAGKAALGTTRAPRSRRQEMIRQVSLIVSLILGVLVLVGVLTWVVVYYK